MIYNAKTKFRAAVEPEFPISVGQLLPSYPQTIALMQLRDKVERKFRLKSGAMYAGELEAMILTPLSVSLTDALANANKSGLIVRSAFQLAAEYAVIADIAQVSQVKEVARELTGSAITSSPIYASIMSYAKREDDGAGKGRGGDRDKESSSKITTAWRSIDTFLHESLATGSTVSDGKVTPLSILLSMQNLDDFQTGITDVWGLLIKYLKQGKGRPLSQDGSLEQAMLLTSIWNRICALCDLALDELAATADSESPSRATFADAWTALLWFDGYLSMVEQYDALFPSAVMQQQSTAWVLALRNQALKYKAYYARLSRSAQSFDIQTFMWVWNEQMALLKPAMPTQTSALSDLEALWARLDDVAKGSLDSFSMTASKSTLDELKAYLDVDILLPSYVFSSIAAPLDDWQVPNPDPTKTGADYIKESDTFGLQDIYSGTKTDLLVSLSAAAGMLEIALGYAARSMTILSSGNMLESASLIPTPTWEPITHLTGHAGDYQQANFELCHPVQEMIPKYTGSDLDPAPVMRDDVMKPKYLIPLHQTRATDSQIYPPEAKISWDVDADIATDIVSAAYARQPIPSCYTWHRSGLHLSATINNYEQLIRGVDGLQDCKDTFWSTLAGIIARYRSTYGYSVLDMISGVMFVYAKGDLPSGRISGAESTHTEGVAGVNGWTWLQPRVPVIYGAPTVIFQRQQTVQAGTLESAGLSVVKIVSLTNQDGGTYQIAFALHDKFPIPDTTRVVQYPTTPTSFMPLTVMKSALSDSVNRLLGISRVDATNSLKIGTLQELMDELRSGAKGKAFKWVENHEYYPGSMVAPHMAWAYSSSSYLLESELYKKTEMVKIKVKINRLTGFITTLSIIDNPIQVVSFEEYNAHIDASDPSPLADRSVGKGVEEPDNTPESPGAPTEAKPTPSVAAPSPVNTSGDGSKAPSIQGSQSGAEAAAAAVSNAPILANNEVDGNGANSLEVPTGEGPTSILRAEAPAPLAGKADAGKSDGDNVPELPAKAQFWKLMQGEKIVDVIQADQAPAGYVPATEKEFELFSKQKDAGGEPKE